MQLTNYTGVRLMGCELVKAFFRVQNNDVMYNWFCLTDVKLTLFRNINRKISVDIIQHRYGLQCEFA